MAFPEPLAEHGWRPLEPGDAPDLAQVEAVLRSTGAWGLFGLDAVARRRDEPQVLLFEPRSTVGTYLVVRVDGTTGGAIIVFQGGLRHLIDDDTICIL